MLPSMLEKRRKRAPGPPPGPPPELSDSEPEEPEEVYDPEPGKQYHALVEAPVSKLATITFLPYHWIAYLRNLMKICVTDTLHKDISLQ